MNARSLAVRVSASLVSVALALIGLEVLLRFSQGGSGADIEPLNFVQGYFTGLYDYHHRLGWIPRPHASGVKWGVEVVTGDDGIRLNGHPLDRQDLHAQILAVGDSFTFGDDVGNADTWPARLETLLRERLPADRHQVLNAGVSSYGLDQIVLRAEELVPKYRPRVLIASFIQNDVDRCLYSSRHGAPKPYFTLTRVGLELRNAPVPAPQKPSPFRLALLRHSMLVNEVAARSPLGPFLAAGTMGEFTRTGSPSATDIAVKLVARLGALTDAYDVRLLVMAQPESVDEVMEPRVRTVLDSLRPSPRETVAVVDAFEALRVHAGTPHTQPQSLFLSTVDGHMSPQGNHFIAQTLLPSVLTLLEKGR